MCGLVLMVGRRIERTLEYLNWIMVALIIGGLGVLALLFVPAYTWAVALAGFAGFDLNTEIFSLFQRALTSSCSARLRRTQAAAAWRISR